MDEEMFRAHEEKDGWSDADEDSVEADDASLSFG